MTMQKHVLAALLTLTCTANAGKWISDHGCTAGNLATPFHVESIGSVQQARAQCAEACDGYGDECVAATLFFSSDVSIIEPEDEALATCYLTASWQSEQCVDVDTGLLQTDPFYQLYIPGRNPAGLPMPTDPPTDSPIPAPADSPVPAPTLAQEPSEGPAPTPSPSPAPTPDSDACEDLRPNLLVSIKKGKKQKKTMQLENEEDICECAELCNNAGYDIFQYYSRVKREKVQTSCKCMNMTNKVKAKTKKGYTAGALTSVAKEAFSKFKVKKSKKDQNAGL